MGTVIAGIELLRQEVGGNTAFSVDERDIYSAFAGYTGEFGPHALSASVRNDDNSQFGSQPTGAIGYAFRVTPEWRLRANAGTAFHAPTFSDLYFPGFGNPNLLPEEGTSWEVGAEYRRGQQQLGLTYFQNRITNLIVFDATTFKPVNVGEASINGFELAYNGELFGLELRARLTLQNRDQRRHRQAPAAARGCLRQRRDRAQLRAGAGRRGGGRGGPALRFAQRSPRQRDGRLRPVQSRGHVLVRQELERSSCAGTTSPTSTTSWRRATTRRGATFSCRSSTHYNDRCANGWSLR